MIAALIFVISVAAGMQLAVFSWRAAMISFADQALSAAMQPAVAQFSKAMTRNDFREISAIQALCPALAPSQTKQLRHVQVYYKALEMVNSLSKSIPACSAWAQAEMATCSRYAVAVMDQRLQTNQACFAVDSSY